MVVRQFDVVKNPNTRTRKLFPYLVVLQHDLLDTFDTVVVAPVVSVDTAQPTDRLHPVLSIDGANYLLATHDLGATARDRLGDRVTNISDHRDSIVAAIDLVFTGT